MYAKYARVRDAAGMTDNEVAVKAGITASTIYDWKQRSVERPETELSVPTLVKVAKVLNCTIDELVGEGEEV